MDMILQGLKYVAAGFCFALIISVKSFGADGPVEVEGVITDDALWSGDVLVYSDVLVPEGVTITIAPGTTVMFAQTESSKIEPMFLSMETELLVRGVLVAKGSKDAPIRFVPAPEEYDLKKPARGDWGGIIFDGPAASASVLSGAVIAMADSAVACYNSSPTVTGCRIEDNRYGVVCAGGSAPRLSLLTVTGGEFGLVASHGAKPVMENCTVEGNEQDFLIKETGP